MHDGEPTGQTLLEGARGRGWVTCQIRRGGFHTRESKSYILSTLSTTTIFDTHGICI